MTQEPYATERESDIRWSNHVREHEAEAEARALALTAGMWRQRGETVLAVLAIVPSILLLMKLLE